MTFKKNIEVTCMTRKDDIVHYEISIQENLAFHN